MPPACVPEPPTWGARRNQIVENAIGDLLVESSAIAITREVKLERLGFDATPVRNVLDA